MRQPTFPRSFPLPRLFNSASPWNQPVNEVVADSDNRRTMLVAFDILRELSWETLAKDRAKLDELLATFLMETCAKDDQTIKDIDALRKRICREQTALKIVNGLDRGGNVALQIGCSDYTFPIFPVRRDNEIAKTADIRMKTYDGRLWEPPYSRRRKEVDTWIAEEVSLPAGRFRPSGPGGNDSDGSVILYDVVTFEEFDFWQVTTSHEPNETGGGHAGDEILEAGSVARFDTKGTGARIPPDGEPLGSSRATGLPYLGGLLVPEDFAGGPTAVIQHALAFTFPRSRFFPFRAPGDPPDYIYPAVKSETSHFIQNPYALAAGMRIRLKSTLKSAIVKRTILENGEVKDVIEEVELPMDKWNTLPPAVRIFLTALHDYGAFLVDGAEGFGIAAEDRETAVMDDHIVEELIKEPVREKETPWESLMETINDYLSFRLWEKQDEVLIPGLALGFFLKDDEGFRFWTNFEVVSPLAIPS